MSLKKTIKMMPGLILLIVCISAFGTPAAAENNQANWHKVGQEVGQTVKDIGKATKKTYENTKKKTKETYEKTKKKTEEAWQKTKKESQKAEKTGKEKSQGFWHSVSTTIGRWYREAKAKIHAATAPSNKQPPPAKKSAPSPSSSQ